MLNDGTKAPPRIAIRANNTDVYQNVMTPMTRLAPVLSNSSLAQDDLSLVGGAVEAFAQPRELHMLACSLLETYWTTFVRSIRGVFWLDQRFPCEAAALLHRCMHFWKGLHAGNTSVEQGIRYGFLYGAMTR